MPTRPSLPARTRSCAAVAVTALLLPAAMSCAPVADAAPPPIRLTAAKVAFTDTQGQRWTPAGSRLDGVRRPTARPLPTVFGTPALYTTSAVGATGARIAVREPGRYVVTLYLVNPDVARKPHVFDVSTLQTGSAGRRVAVKRRRVTVPAGDKETLPIHAAFEVPVRGRDLQLRFRSVEGAVVVSDIEVQWLGPTSMPPVKQTWEETFDGPAGAPPNPDVWQMQTGDGWGAQHAELQTYTTRPENISLNGNGQLAITTRRDLPRDDGTLGYTSGRIDTHVTFDLTRARVSARMTTPSGAGLWPAFWAWFNRAEQPQTGEVDVAELVGRDPKTLYAFVHGPVPGDPPWVYQNGAELHRSTPIAGAPHTYEIRTEPNLVEFYFDGVQYGSVARGDLPATAPWVIRPDLPFRLILNMAVGAWAGPPDATTKVPAQMTVDGVSVWS